MTLFVLFWSRLILAHRASKAPRSSGSAGGKAAIRIASRSVQCSNSTSRSRSSSSRRTMCGDPFPTTGDPSKDPSSGLRKRLTNHRRLIAAPVDPGSLFRGHSRTLAHARTGRATLVGVSTGSSGVTVFARVVSCAVKRRTTGVGHGFSGDSAVASADLIKYLDVCRQIGPIAEAKQWIFERLQVTGGHWVLDVGCGTGDDVAALAAVVGPAGRAVGVDSSEAMIAEASSRHGALHGVSFELADAQQLPFESGQFDACRT